MDSMTEQTRRDGAILFAGTAVNVLVSAEAMAGAFSMLLVANPPGCWTPPHVHRNEDETVLVLAGTLRVETEERAMNVGPGQAVVLPRGRPHRLGNTGAQETRFLVLCTPGGFDDFVRAAGRPMPKGGPTMDEADIARLVQAAPRHGIELLAPAAPRPVPAREAAAAADEVDVLGIRIQVLAECGPGDDDPCLMRVQVPPGGMVPMHCHADREVIYGLGGVLEAWIGPVGKAAWQAVGAGQVADIPAGVPHALRNQGDVPADVLLIATRRIAGLFREVGCPVGDAPHGPPSPDRIQALAAASYARGYWLAGEAENAAIGL
ncbi:cupin domain-containing protein [Lichenicoccus roseus]|nr:cupin domain-containing protein [Lichenicoccus roseus]